MTEHPLLAQLRHLPVMPALGLHLVRGLQDEGLGRAQLERLIAADPALSAQLLRMVNSPFYGFSGRIGSLGDALSLLGQNLVRRIVIATAIGRQARQVLPPGPAGRDFWQRQLLVAALGRMLPSDCDPEQAYVAGLLHQIGRLAMLTLPEAPAEMVLADAPEVLALERQRYGMDHAELGAALLQSWHLPPALADAVRLCEAPERPPAALAGLVWRARQLALQLRADPDLVHNVPWAQSQQLDAEQLKCQLEEIQQLCDEFDHA